MSLINCIDKSTIQAETTVNIISLQENFFEIVKNGDVKTVQSAINAGAEVNAKTKDGVTPIMVAAENNSNHLVITELVKAGAEVNAKDKYDWTPIVLAASNNSNHLVITELVKAGAKVNAKDRYGVTAIAI